MKNSETPPSAGPYIGHVKDGVIVLDTHVPLADGQVVRVEPLAQGGETPLDADRAKRVQQLRQLLAEWTEEDAKLPDDEADRLHTALEHGHGLDFRSPPLD